MRYPSHILVQSLLSWVFQARRSPSEIPYLCSTTQQLSPDTTSWYRLQYGTAPGWMSLPGTHGAGVGVGGGGGGIQIVETGGGGGGGGGGGWRVDWIGGKIVGLLVYDTQIVVPGKEGRGVGMGLTVVGRLGGGGERLGGGGGGGG